MLVLKLSEWQADGFYTDSELNCLFKEKENEQILSWLKFK